MGAVVPVAGAAVSLVLTVGLLTVVTTTGSSAAVQCLPSSVAVTGTVPAAAALDARQTTNATAIVSEVVSRRMPSRAAVIAIATVMQESGLRNLASQAVPESLGLPHDPWSATQDAPPGDHDSVGLFQQRASWGSVAERLTPSYSAGKFLERLQQVDGWEVMPVTVAAQTVQVSAFPDAYAKWEQPANVIVNGLLGRSTEAGDGNQTAGDTPGLYVEGDGLLTALAPALPPTYNGGAVTISTARPRTTTEGLAELTAQQTSLPGSLLVSLGARDHLTEDSAATYRSQVTALLALAGDDRTVYWLTTPGADLSNGVLRAVAAADPQLQLVDLDQTIHAHPEWLDGGALIPAGITGSGKALVTALGAGSEDDPTDPTNVLAGDGCSDGLGGYSSVPVADCTFTLPRANPRTCQDAIRWELAQIDGPPKWFRRCMHIVGEAYGWGGSGWDDPHAMWADSRITRHAPDPAPPAGALVVWSGGTNGHVALSVGNGMVISNDIRGHGTLALVPLAEITTEWNDPYVGWADPYFPAAG